tara:strand:- start:110 stop:370 length:261 start_codon:yes stop_codon:yes gene_type:complete
VGLYSYFCTECKENFDARHSYKDKLKECILCKAKNPSRTYNNPIKIVTKKKTDSKQKTGKVVNDSIKEAKEEIKKEKNKYKKRTKK